MATETSTPAPELVLCESIKDIRSAIDANIKTFKSSITLLKNIENQVRMLEKKYIKLSSKKKKANNGSVPGFLIPSAISNQLRDFMLSNYEEILNEEIKDEEGDNQTTLDKKEKTRNVNKQLLEIIPQLNKGKEEGSAQISRARVTQFISRFIKFHKIQKENNRTFVDMESPAGKKLGKIFKGHEDSEVTFYGLSKFTTHHFLPKSEQKPVEEKKVEEPKPIETTTLKNARTKRVTKARKAKATKK